MATGLHRQLAPWSVHLLAGQPVLFGARWIRTRGGHGSTVEDRFGNWWHVGTIRISVGHVFERRIGIYPAGFDADGVLFCNQEFADHPIVIPQRRADPWTEVPTGWRLLSFQRPVVATSSLDGSSAAGGRRRGHPQRVGGRERWARRRRDRRHR